MRCYLLALLLTLCGSPALAEWTAIQPQIAAQVVRVSTLRADEDNPGTCSGLVLTREGHVLTAAHCVDSKASIAVGERHAALLVTNRVLDLAVLKVDRLPTGAMPVTLAETAPTRGCSVLVAGYAFGLPNLVVQAGIVGNPYEPACQCLLLNVDVMFGDSGGGVFDARGALVAVVHALRSQGPAHLGMAVPLDVVRAFIAPYVEVKR